MQISQIGEDCQFHKTCHTGQRIERIQIPEAHKQARQQKRGCLFGGSEESLHRRQVELRRTVQLPQESIQPP